MSFPSLIRISHLVGLALGVGSATVKFVLLLKCKTEPDFIPTYLKVARPITRLIILGIIVLTLSGIGFLWVGIPYTALLGRKIALVAAIWVLGPLIDNVAEPRFRSLAPEPGKASSQAFMRAQRQYLVLEAAATMLFYIVIIMWVTG